jgi:hypothetical protein
MRAKSIFENQNFERSGNAKSSMKVGGIIPRIKFDEFVEEFHSQVSMAAVQSDEAWEDYLLDTFLGKTITGKMVKMPTINTSDGRMSGKRETGEFTITVKDIRTTDSLSTVAPPGNNERPLSILLADSENNMYEMRPSEKYYIK